MLAQQFGFSLALGEESHVRPIMDGVQTPIKCPRGQERLGINIQSAITHTRRVMRQILRGTPFVVASLLTACGGGGGGGGGGGSTPVAPTPLVYTGSTSAAVVTATNAGRLADNVLGTGDTTGGPSGFSGVAIAAQTQTRPAEGITLVRAIKEIRRALTDGASQQRNRPQAHSAVVPIDETEPCDGGGTRSLSGTLNDNGSGTLTAVYSNCHSGTTTMNGPATLRIDAFDLANLVITDATITFTRITVRTGGSTWEVSGTSRQQKTVSTNTDTGTDNFVALNSATGQMLKMQDLVNVDVSDNAVSPTTFTRVMSGRMFDNVHGFVTITTPVPLRFANIDDDFAQSGEVLMTGSGNRTIRATALSTALVRLSLDVDGDGTADNVVTLQWTDLPRPVGSDLGDSDADGMHNSWETVYGLNPADASDASLDADGDTVSNLDEYRYRTNPKDATSRPPAVDLALTASYPSSFARVDQPFGGYQLTVTNTSANNASDVVVTVSLPSNVTFSSASGPCSGAQTVTCTIGSLAPAAGTSVILNVTPREPGTYTLFAEITTGSYEPSSGNNSASMRTLAGWGTETLQARIDAAPTGSTVLVDPGIYIGLLNFKFNRNVTLRSVAGPASTTLIGDFSRPEIGPVLMSAFGGTLSGFTIAHSGRGVEIQGDGNTVSGNVFEGNIWQGVWVPLGAATVEGNVFRNNSCLPAGTGIIAVGGASMGAATARIVNNVIENHSACPAIAIKQDGIGKVINNTIVGNAVGIQVDSGSAGQVFQNNVIVQNGTGLQVISGATATSAAWTNNLVFGNTANYSGTADLTGTNGNVSANPLFVDAASGNYRLGTGSAAIDAGSASNAPAVDFDGAARPHDGDGNGSALVDMGAFEK